MFIAGFPAGPWGTNCYVVATEPGAECGVVDPGKDAASGVAEVVREHGLKPVAVLVSHGSTIGHLVGSDGLVGRRMGALPLTSDRAMALSDGYLYAIVRYG